MIHIIITAIITAFIIYTALSAVLTRAGAQPQSLTGTPQNNYTLNETQRLTWLFPIDLYKIILILGIILVLAATVIRIGVFGTSLQSPGLSIAKIVDGFSLGIVLAAFLVFEIIPRRFGFIRIDKSRLVIPHFFSSSEFTPSESCIAIRRISKELYLCKIASSSKSDWFFANSKSLSLLSAWLPSRSDAC